MIQKITTISNKFEYTNRTDSGVFEYITNCEKWNNESNYSKHNLAFFSQFGDRPISNVFNYFALMNEEDKTALGEMISNIYATSWNRMYDALNLDYDVIENYNSTEIKSETANEKTTDSGTNSLNTVITNTTTDKGDTTNTTTDKGSNSTDTTNENTNTLNANKTTTESGTSENTNTQNVDMSVNTSVYAYDATASSPTEVVHTIGTTTTTDNGSTTNNSTISDVNTTTDKGSTTSDTQTDNTTTSNGTNNNTNTFNSLDNRNGTNTNSGNRDNTLDYTLTRTGNIGVTTSQQMIESEINLRKLNKFLQIVYSELANFISIPCYNAYTPNINYGGVYEYYP